MTELTNYRCDICGEVFLDQESAQKCEEFHIKPTQLDSMSFGSIVKTNIPYPGIMLMQMEDGAIIKYVYNEIVNVPQKAEGAFNVPVAGDDDTSVGCGCDEVDGE